MKTQIKILHLLPSLNLNGGTPRKTLSLIEGSKFYQGIYTWAKWEGEVAYENYILIFQDKGVVVQTGPKTRNLFRHVARIVRLIDQQGFTVIHGYFDGGAYLAALVRLIRPNIRTVVSFVVVLAPGRCIRQFLLGQALRRIDRSIFISQYVKREMTTQLPRLAGHTGKIIYNGTDSRNVSGKPVVRPANNYFVGVGGLNGHKNYKILIQAAAQLIEMGYRNFCIDIIGDGPLREDLIALSDELNVTTYIRFLGYTERVGDYLNAADVYVHPASNEGFGIAVVEAMQMGLPVVLAEAGGLPELAIHKESALYVPANDPHAWAATLCRLMGSAELRNRLGHGAAERASALFSMNQFVSNHDCLYEGLFKVSSDQ